MNIWDCDPDNLVFTEGTLIKAYGLNVSNSASLSLSLTKNCFFTPIKPSSYISPKMIWNFLRKPLKFSYLDIFYNCPFGLVEDKQPIIDIVSICLTLTSDSENNHMHYIDGVGFGCSKIRINVFEFILNFYYLGFGNRKF